MIVDDTEALLRRCFPNNRVGRVDFRDGGVVVVNVYCGHLACLFPQHGPGKKHERRILLEDWQRSIVEAEPWPFLRGCIRSDGCVFVNRTGRYEYLSYGFANYSADILDLVESTCRAQGLVRAATRRAIRLNRRGDVDTPARACRLEILSPRTARLEPSAAVAELGRRAAFRSP